ncbi:carboxypeptidase-like regulatory domain-containing protein [Caloramator sp. mosi_1]|uniref:carboxypeptidase-like regulatory domain-containing protein n=1 Tax=Caloramator sp. mosi_1 TaxID=3023090 RepID=UPI0023630740|nr:carboxypeptidase-like regulatory domain-containing protein [Caloramator sp. mosi_1]WDC84868.1 carboxypeptidase-like regulatory domain-containing protein [Caloramator sp. mosi_1]
MVKAVYDDIQINLSGKILDCKTKELLSDVRVKVYRECNLIMSEVFSQEYSFNLPVGVYTIIFEKDGYYKKFIAPIIYTDEYIIYDVRLLKKKLLTVNLKIT